MEMNIITNAKLHVVDLTQQVQDLVESGVKAAIIHAMHTTCAITTADLDPGTDLDLLDAAWGMIPKYQYRHQHDPAHVPAHLASSIIGPSVIIPVRNGKLALGKWQRIVLVELDGPKTRTVLLTKLYN